METLELLRSGQLQGIKKLNLACGLTELPPEIFELADSLEVLELSDNQLRSLPPEFARLQRLKVLFLNHNQFETVPQVLAQCPNLDVVSFKANQIHTWTEAALPKSVRWLVLTQNQLTSLPRSIGQLSQLQKLMLAGNQLTDLPIELANCQRLELVRLAANQLRSLPPWLSQLPRLAWIALAGNPFCDVSIVESIVESVTVPKISWQDLEISSKLGEGASGIIYEAIWRTTQPVAVKVFKGALTSDGLPEDELRACLAAGHPQANLVQVLAEVIDHPDAQSGLVLTLIPPEFENLGGPPSIASCTRDVYQVGTVFAWGTIVRIAQGIAAAVAHLHDRGILHGDLYAHNILVNGVGHAYLGDFGAASLGVEDRSLQQIEVRAFGCLLEDLLDRCEALDRVTDIESVDRLWALQQDCVQEIPSLRPLFREIELRLRDLRF